MCIAKQMIINHKCNFVLDMNLKNLSWKLYFVLMKNNINHLNIILFYPSIKILVDVSENVCSIIEHCLELMNVSKRLCILAKTAFILSKLEFALL